jgi:hypothetical protein
MRRIAVLALAVVLLGGWLTLAADHPPLSVAEGKVEKVEKDALAFQPRGASGRFGKSITLRITGTSNLSSVSYQERAGKQVLVQREIKASDLKANQLIAVIYSAASKGDAVLLSAVAQPTGEK